jgi:hypothetical protein
LSVPCSALSIEVSWMSGAAFSLKVILLTQGTDAHPLGAGGHPAY